MPRPIPPAKRVFDLVVGTAMFVVLLPVLCLTALAILVTDGRPIFYVSARRVSAGPAARIIKFRTMRRHADRIANRETVPVSGTRFLNLPSDSPLYTPIGRLIERTMLTEMPQLLQVLQGRLSLVGNRPLPSNVVASLSEAFPDVERRFLLLGGLTGPVQLVGRDDISDGARLAIEIAYCEAVATSYSVLLDLRILSYTILRCLRPRYRLTPDEALGLVQRRGPARPALPVRRGHARMSSIGPLQRIAGRRRQAETR